MAPAIAPAKQHATAPANESKNAYLAKILGELEEEEHDPLPASVPLDHRLLAGPQYASVDLLHQDLNHWAKSCGLAFVKRRVSNYVPGIGGQESNSSATEAEFDSPRIISTKVGCPWKAIATALEKNDQLWVLEIKRDIHNHDRSFSNASRQNH